MPNSDARPVTTGAHTLVSPYGRARRAHDDGLALERRRRSRRRGGTCPAPASPMIDTTPLWPLRTSCRAAASSARSCTRPTNGTSQRTGRMPGGVGAGDEPRLLVLLAPAQAGDAERLAVDRRRAQGDGGGAGEHAARRGQGLQPRGGVHDVAHRRVVGAGEDADEHLAGVEADAHAGCGGSAPGLGDEAGQRVLHPQRRAHGPLGVVLVGDRRAEQGDDGVAEQLVDAAAERLDVGDEALEARLDEALHPLGVEVLGERRVADEVGEEHGDDAPLLERRRRPSSTPVPHDGQNRGPVWHRMVARGAHATNRHCSRSTAWGVTAESGGSGRCRELMPDAGG